MCFSCVHPYSVDVRGRGCAASRQAGLKTTGVAGICKREVIIFAASVSATVVKQLFLQCSSLERASRSLAKTGLFFGLSEVFFSRLFSVRLFGGLGGAFGGSGVDLGAIWRAFGGHFCDFFRVRWIFEHNGFTIVKQYFLRSGRVLDRGFSVLCFWIDTVRVFLVEFWGFVGPQGLPRGPNGSLWGTLRDQIRA